MHHNFKNSLDAALVVTKLSNWVQVVPTCANGGTASHIVVIDGVPVSYQLFTQAVMAVGTWTSKPTFNDAFEDFWELIDFKPVRDPEPDTSSIVFSAIEAAAKKDNRDDLIRPLNFKPLMAEVSKQIRSLNRDCV